MAPLLREASRPRADMSFEYPRTLNPHGTRRLGANASGVGTTPPIIDPGVAAVSPSQFFKRLPERHNIRVLRIILGEGIEHADTPNGLLRACCERPCGRRTTDKGDEFSSPHDALEIEDYTLPHSLNERVVRHSKIGRPLIYNLVQIIAHDPGLRTDSQNVVADPLDQRSFPAGCRCTKSVPRVAGDETDSSSLGTRRMFSCHSTRPKGFKTLRRNPPGL
jgi:hypothetical protein